MSDDRDSRVGRALYGHELFKSGRVGEWERVSSLAEAFDAGTRAVLGDLCQGRCLDVGAGPGTITRWLADNPRTTEVVAVDRDTHFLDNLDVQVVRTDLTADRWQPDEPFDLIHCRFVLMFLPQRRDVLKRLASWLRPGGVLVVADPRRMYLPVTGHQPFRVAYRALWEGLVSTLSADPGWGDHYPYQLHECGLVDVGVRVDVPPLVGAGPQARFWAGTFDQMSAHLIGSGLVDRQILDAADAQLRDPDFTDVGMGMSIAWGKRR
ncbi:methyltransferase domain-containing protein [Nocardia sp. NPDC049220]|uniref:methyltransferase domain-containing protein n=1 Tax=Nocardia sp. NPDC049220 TaxID=3155273 RepID=UPI0033FE0575